MSQAPQDGPPSLRRPAAAAAAAVQQAGRAGRQAPVAWGILAPGPPGLSFEGRAAVVLGLTPAPARPRITQCLVPALECCGRPAHGPARLHAEES